MHIEIEIQNGFCMLRLKGRFVTGSDSDYVRTRDALQSAGARNVLADCGEVPYIDSTGISFMVGLHKALRDSGGCFALANVNHRIRKVLEITGLNGVIRVLDDSPPAPGALSSAA